MFVESALYVASIYNISLEVYHQVANTHLAFCNVFLLITTALMNIEIYETICYTTYVALLFMLLVRNKCAVVTDKE